MAKRKALTAKAMSRAEVIEQLKISAFVDGGVADVAIALLSATCATCEKFHKHDPRDTRYKNAHDGYCGHFYANVKRSEGCNAHEPRG